MIISDFLKQTFQRLSQQPAHADFLPPITQHVTDHIVHYETGYFGFVMQFQGIPFESEDDKQLLTQFHNLSLTLATIGKTFGERLELTATLQRRARLFEREYRFDNVFCQEFADNYLAKFRAQPFFNNEFFMSFVLKYDDYEDGLKETDDLIHRLTANLHSYEPTVLTAYTNEHGIAFSEVYEFLGGLVNYDSQPVPLTHIAAQQVIGNADLHFGADICEIRTPQRVKYATLYDLKDFGVSKPLILTQILDLPFEFTFTQSFNFIASSGMVSTINKQLNNLSSVGDEAEEQQAEMVAGKGKLTAGELMFGDYHAALVVYADSAKEAAAHGNTASARFLNSGSFIFNRASVSAPYTFFSQVMGSRVKPRAVPKTTENLATTFGMHNYSHGKAFGNPLGDGLAVMPFQTKSSTVFDFNFHFTSPKENNIGDQVAGHTLILGATGTGKTTVETALLAFADRFNPSLFVLDLDAGMQIYIQAVGGSYYRLAGGEPTGLNPFQLPDSPKVREFLYSLVGICGRSAEGNVSADEEAQIKVAVDTLMNQVQYEHRNFSVLLQNIPHSATGDSLRARLGRWCRSENGRFAWCLDNAENKFNPDDFHKVGFDMTDILQDNYPPTEPVLAYMFFLRELMMERVAARAGILCTVVEEFWWPTRFSVTEEFILKILKTDRKRGGWIILTSQSPEDAINCSIFPAIVQQTPTKLFLPNPDAEFVGSYDKCGMNRKEYDELTKLSLDSRTFLVKQSRQSTFAKLDLYGATDALAVLSGTSENIELLNSLLAEQPNATPDEWYPVFKQRIAERRANKQQRLLEQ